MGSRAEGTEGGKPSQQKETEEKSMNIHEERVGESKQKR